MKACITVCIIAALAFIASCAAVGRMKYAESLNRTIGLHPAFPAP